MTTANDKSAQSLRKHQTQPQQQRQLKVHHAYSEYRTRKHPYEVHTRITPAIRIQGLWLRQAGFEIGDFINIEVSHQQLIISIKE